MSKNRGPKGKDLSSLSLSLYLGKWVLDPARTYIYIVHVPFSRVLAGDLR